MFDELYQEVILDHNRKPRNCRRLSNATSEADGYNPLCGDQVTVYVQLEKGRIVDITFEGSGCAISTASASMMTERLKGKTLDEVDDIFCTFRQMVTGDGSNGNETLGKLEAFSGLSDYPMRVKCATLCWHAMQSAMNSDETVASTE